MANPLSNESYCFFPGGIFKPNWYAIANNDIPTTLRPILRGLLSLRRVARLWGARDTQTEKATQESSERANLLLLGT